MAQARQQKLKDILRSDPFYSSDTQLDLSAFPTLTPLSDATFEDDKFAPIDTRGAGSGSKELKAFLIRETAEQMPPTTVHANGHEFRVFYRDGAWHADGEIDGARHRYSAPDREDLLSKLGQVTKREAALYRELNEQEELEIIRYVQGGDVQAALGQYLFTATNRKEFASPFEILDNPAYRGCVTVQLLSFGSTRGQITPPRQSVRRSSTAM